MTTLTTGLRSAPPDWSLPREDRNNSGCRKVRNARDGQF